MLNPTQFQALTFDCYGTLIDWETGILAVLCPWVDRNRVTVSDDDLLSAYAQAEPVCETELPGALYPDILRAVHHRLAIVFGIVPSDADADTLAQSVGDWPAFPDTAAALQVLKQHYKLVIVSNIDRASFARSNAKLGVAFDAIVTAEEVGAYKPDHRMFARAFEVVAKLGIARGGILHVAQSLYHDHVPAQALGIKTCWVDRRGGRAGSGATPVPAEAVTPDLVVNSLAELVAVFGSDGGE